MMPRSDDEFSDCDLDENERWWWQQWRHHWCTYYMYLSASASASQFWSLLNPSLSSSSSVVILAELHFHFTSPVGPTVAIPESPSEVFELIFTPSLMDTRQICMQKQWWEMKSMMLGTSSQLMNSRLTWDSVSSWGCRSIGFSFGQLLELRPCPLLLPHCWQDFQGLFLRNFSLSSLCS